MIIASVPHEKRQNLRIMLIGDEGNPPRLKHFYLQRRKGRLHPWETSRKLRAVDLEKYAKKYGFDEVELIFELEEAGERAEKEERLL